MNEINRLRELAGITTLNELENVGITDVGQLDLTPQEINDANQVSTVMQVPLFKVEKDGVTIFFLVHEDEVVAWSKGYVYAYTSNGDHAFLAKKTYVDPSHRGKGLMTGLYDTLNKHLKLTVMSDYKQSIEAKVLWKKIYATKNGKVKKYNATTGDISDIVDFEEVYGDPDLHLMLEMSINRKKMFESTNGFTPHDMVVYPCEAYYGYP